MVSTLDRPTELGELEHQDARGQGMKICIVACLFLAGCSTTQPYWSDATPKQRQAGEFREDAAYWDSPEGQLELDKEADTIIRLQEDIVWKVRHRRMTPDERLAEDCYEYWLQNK
jgi:hypothetical protein